MKPLIVTLSPVCSPCADWVVMVTGSGGGERVYSSGWCSCPCARWRRTRAPGFSAATAWWRSSSGADGRRLGRHVAADGNLSVRLVARGRGPAAVRPPQPHARAGRNGARKLMRASITGTRTARLSSALQDGDGPCGIDPNGGLHWCIICGTDSGRRESDIFRVRGAAVR